MLLLYSERAGNREVNQASVRGIDLSRKPAKTTKIIQDFSYGKQSLEVICVYRRPFLFSKYNLFYIKLTVTSHFLLQILFLWSVNPGIMYSKLLLYAKFSGRWGTNR